MRFIMLLVWALPLAYLTFTVFHYVFLAVAYFVTKDRAQLFSPEPLKYLLLVPAHDEEAMIGRLLDSLKRVDYDPGSFKVFVIADNCVDGTAKVASGRNANVLVRHDESRRGKGSAIEWALGQVDLDVFDAVVIADADNLIDPGFFRGLNEAIAGGASAIQCNNCLANSDETAFTKVIHLSRTINNELYHHAKHKIGLSSYLMGNGMCFTTQFLGEHRWTTGTIAEDYEYYANLIEHNELVGFAANSRLYHQESAGIRQASKQRLRWSSGRFQVARKYGWRLLRKGLQERNYRIIDASFPLILPNLSLMVNMTAVALLTALVMHFFYPITFVVYWLMFLLVMEVAYFASGIYLTKMSVGRFLFALSYAPLFLAWKGFIDILGISGKNKQEWGRSKRL